MSCQAIIDDWKDLRGYFPRQGIHQPGDKPCSREAKEHVGHLHLCPTHARMAREGLVSEKGRVAPRADIANVRRYPEKFPNGLNKWFKRKKS